MKAQVLERARSTIEAYLREQCADAALEVLSMDPEVDGNGDEFLWICLKYDDASGANGLLDSAARIRMMDRLQTELEEADLDAFPVFSFIAGSDLD